MQSRYQQPSANSVLSIILGKGFTVAVCDGGNDNDPMGTISAHGRNGQIEFDGKTVIIRREGFAARATHGRSEKSIPLRHITAVQMKPVSLLAAGFIQFTVPGESSNNKGKGARTFNAAKDENSVIFLKGQEPEFAALRQAIQTGLSDL